jgi:hypothetical protein
MDKQSITLVLHGGLGNQLFQYFLAKALKFKHPQYTIFIVDDFLSKYDVARSFELSNIVKSEDFQYSHASWIVRLRLPKVISRILGDREFALCLPCYGYIVDGYYQSVESYEGFPEYCIANTIASMRSAVIERNILLKPLNPKIRHLRLTDFFRNTEEARSYVKQCLAEINSDIDFVTDQEDLLLEELRNFKSPFKVNLVPTGHMKAWDLVTLMSSYREIVTNGSTLPMWVAILAKTELITSNKNHSNLWSKLVCL